MYEIDIVDLGNKIREYRKAQNISIEELGNIIGKSKTTVARYETGEIVIDIITAMEICNALNIDLNDICIKEMQGIEKDININPFNSFNFGNTMMIFHVFVSKKTCSHKINCVSPYFLLNLNCY